MKNGRIIAIAAALVVMTGCSSQQQASVSEYLQARQDVLQERAKDPETKYMDPNWHYHSFPGDSDYAIAQSMAN